MPTRVMNKSGADEISSGDQKFFVGKKVVFEDVITGQNGFLKSVSCSEESSSIGKNSDDISENSLEKSGDGEEVQSSYKGPLDAMEALEQVLPIRRGISRFYNGKSKSFASLADASSSTSIKDLAKPENSHVRKRRNLLACSLNWDKSRSSPLRGNSGSGSGSGISKRVTNTSRATLALAVAMSSSENDKQALECNSHGSSSPLSVSSPRKDFPSWRSFSLADLQQCVAVGFTCSTSNEVATKPC